MTQFTLRQLRYFQSVAHHGHFGHAADASAMSQPALSMQIKELETTLGHPLFERSSRKVRLTSFGMEFLTKVEAILRQVEELDDYARAAADGFGGKLRLGVIPTVAPYVLPDVIRGLQAHFTDLDIHVRETLTPTLIEELGEGRIDTALLALPVSEHSLTEYPLLEEAFMLVRPAHQRALPVPNVDNLQEMRLLLLEEGHCFRDQALAFCSLSAPSAREGLDATSLSTLVQMVGAGIGVTLIPEMAVAVETRSAPVAIDRFSGLTPKRTLGMVWRRTNPLDARLRQIAEITKKALLAQRNRGAD